MWHKKEEVQVTHILLIFGDQCSTSSVVVSVQENFDPDNIAKYDEIFEEKRDCS